MARGCIPKKTWVRSANVISLVRRASEFGIRADSIGFDWQAIRQRKRDIVAALSVHKEESLEDRGITCFRERGHFLSPHELELDGHTVRAEKVVLATGSRPIRLPIPGVEHAIASSEALDLPDPPRRVVIIGGGFIAMEFCHIFHAFGAEVTILEAMPRILLQADAEVSTALAEACQARGIAVHTGARVRAIEGTPGSLRVVAEVAQGEQGFPCDTVLLAAGREANVERLDLDRAGVRMAPRGIHVDDFLRTTAPNVYAAGDVVNRFQLTPVASYEGRIAARNALTDQPVRPDYRLVPNAVFAVVEVAQVGLTEDQAREVGHEVTASRYNLAELGSAIANGETEGFVKTVFDRQTHRVLGVHFFCAEASELVHQAVLAMSAGYTPEDLAEMLMIHPSLSEGFLASVTSLRTGHQEGCCG